MLGRLPGGENEKFANQSKHAGLASGGEKMKSGGTRGGPWGPPKRVAALPEIKAGDDVDTTPGHCTLLSAISHPAE